MLGLFKEKFKLLNLKIKFHKEKLHNISWLIVNQVIRKIIACIVSIYVIRYLGPEKFGLLSYAVTFGSLFSAFANLGLDQIIIRNIVCCPEKSYNFLGTALLMKMCGGLTAFVITIVTVIIIRANDLQTILLVSIASLGYIFQILNIIDLWYQTKLLSKYTVISNFCSFFICSIAKLVAIYLNLSIEFFVWITTLEMLLNAVCLSVIYKLNGYSMSKWKFNYSYAKSFLADSWPLVFSGFVTMIYMRIDQIMLKEMAGNKAVGIYSIAVNWGELWYFVPSAISLTFFPSIIKAKQISEEDFYRTLQKFYNIMALVSYFIAIPITITAKWFILVLYGKEFLPAVPILILFIWSLIFTSFEIARNKYLIAMNYQKVQFVTCLIGALINIMLNLILIPMYEGYGCALASLISYWFVSHGSCFFYKPLHKTGLMLTKSIFMPWKFV